MIAAVVLGSLAVRTVTAEYSTGMIRSTFAAMPARRLVLAAKAATVAAFAFPVTLLGNVVGFELGQRIFAGQHVAVAIGHPGVLRAMFFGAVAVSLVAVIGVGIGGLIRHTAGADHHPGADHHRRAHRRPVPAGRHGVSTCPASPSRRP
jgi:ABC-2 type transport system permease protein